MPVDQSIINQYCTIHSGRLQGATGHAARLMVEWDMDFEDDETTEQDSNERQIFEEKDMHFGVT